MPTTPKAANRALDGSGIASVSLDATGDVASHAPVDQNMVRPWPAPYRVPLMFSQLTTALDMSSWTVMSSPFVPTVIDEGERSRLPKMIPVRLLNVAIVVAPFMILMSHDMTSVAGRAVPKAPFVV